MNAIGVALRNEEPVETPVEETDTQTQPQSIVMTGPLSEVYTKALQIVYAKQADNNEETALETIATDVVMRTALKKAIGALRVNDRNTLNDFEIAEDRTDPKAIKAFSIYSDELDGEKAGYVTQALAERRLQTGTRSIMIVEGGEKAVGEYGKILDSGQGPTNLTVKEATESYCMKNGVELYYGFESFIKSLRKDFSA